MPWHVTKSGQCPADRPYAVVKNADGSLVACHATEDAAQKHVTALYANYKPESRSSKTVGPAARAHLKSLIAYYMKKPHPFTACVHDNTKRFGEEGAKRVCATLKDIGEGTTKWRN